MLSKRGIKTARKVLNSIKAKLNLDKSPRGTFIEVFGDDLAYIRYNGCIEARFSSGELTDEEAEEWAQKIIDTCGAPKLITSEIDDMERGFFISMCRWTLMRWMNNLTTRSNHGIIF